MTHSPVRVALPARMVERADRLAATERRLAEIDREIAELQRARTRIEEAVDVDAHAQIRATGALRDPRTTTAPTPAAQAWRVPERDPFGVGPTEYDDGHVRATVWVADEGRTSTRYVVRATIDEARLEGEAWLTEVEVHRTNTTVAATLPVLVAAARAAVDRLVARIHAEQPFVAWAGVDGAWIAADLLDLYDVRVHEVGSPRWVHLTPSVVLRGTTIVAGHMPHVDDLADPAVRAAAHGVFVHLGRVPHEVDAARAAYTALLTDAVKRGLIAEAIAFHAVPSVEPAS